MALKSPFKIFLLISILSIILALILIWGGTSQLAPSLVHYRTLEDAPPYAKVESINAQASGVTVIIKIIDPGNWDFTPINGWVELLGTGQVGNLTIANNGTIIIQFPLIPQYLSLSGTGVRGLIRGYLNGNPAYIAFFDVTPIHVVNNVTIAYAHYEDCNLTIGINYSTLTPSHNQTSINFHVHKKYHTWLPSVRCRKSKHYHLHTSGYRHHQHYDTN